jgi:hypothetical protein
MPGAIGGGGGGTTNQQPQAGGAPQIYQPQNQPSFDQSYQNLLTQLYNPAMGGLQARGNVAPAQQIYPQAQNIAGATAAVNPNVPGAYGSYGSQAVQGAQAAQAGYQNLINQGGGPYGYGTAAANQLLPALGATSAAAYNPAYAQTVSNIQQNPYLTQQQAGAQTGAGYGWYGAGQANQNAGNLASLANALQTYGGSTADQTQAWGPEFQSLANQAQSMAKGVFDLSGSRNDQLQALYGSLVPGLAGGAQSYSAAAGATTPQLQAIGASGAGLAGAAPGLATRAEGTSANALAQANQAGKGLLAAAPGYANMALGANAADLQNISQASRGLMSAAPGFAGSALGLNAPLAGAENAILNTGFDPRSALYQRTQQQVTNQQNAVNALSGVGTSPYGAGVTGQAQQNFNIDWQNQQLARQAQAAGVAQGLSGQQAQNIATGGNLFSGLTQAGGNLGLGVANQQLSDIMGAGNLQSGLTQAGSGIIGNVAQQRLANTAQGANILNQLTQGGGNLGLSAATGQLANTTAGANILGNLTQAAGGLGGTLTQDQITNLLGGASAYNALTGTATGAAATGAGIPTQALNNLLSAYSGVGNLSGQQLGLSGGAANLAASSAGVPANLYQQQQQNVLNALGQQTAGAQAGAGALGGLTSALGGAGGQQVQGLQALQQFGGMPYAAATQQQQNALGALTQQLNLGNALYQLPQQVLNDLQSYLGLGQSAANIGGALNQIGYGQNQANLQNIGQLGGLASAGLFGSPGLGLTGNAGLLGSGTSGLLSSGGLGSLLGGTSGAGLLGGLLGGGGAAANTGSILASMASTVPWAVL